MTSTTNNALRRPTLSELALKSGVSKTAASQILSGKGRISARTREAVMRTAAEMGYELDPHAQRLSVGRYDNLVSLLSFGLDMGTGTLKMSAMQALVIKMGFQISMHAYGFSPVEDIPGSVQLVRQACRMRPRALIVNDGHSDAQSLDEIRQFIASGGLVVSYDYPVDLECDQVLFDRAYSTEIALRHLFEFGHERIGIHLGRRQPRDARYASSRLCAFEKMLGAAGAQINESWIYYSEESYEDAGVDVAEQYLARPAEYRPTGMIVQNDRTAAAFVHALVRAGVRVPQDVSVISDDDLSAARACVVPLTAVTHPCEKIAGDVVHMLSQRLESEKDDLRRTVVRGELISRQSVAAPPGLLEHVRRRP